MGSDLDSHVDVRQAKPLTEIEQIVHDLNNQVMVIQGNASLLQMKTAELLEISELAEQIVQASQRAAALTKKLVVKSPTAGATK